MNVMLNLLLRISNWLELPKNVSRLHLAIYKWLFSFGSIVVVLRTFQYFDYIFPLQYESSRWVITVILITWLISIFLLLSNYKAFYMSVVQLVVSACVLRGFLTFGIFEATHLCASWALVFVVRIENSVAEPDSTDHGLNVLGLFLSIVFFGLIFFHAGIDKLIDLAWIQGEGFRQFVELEWVVEKWFRDFLISQPYFLVAANYLAILIECTFLPLLFFGRFRFVAAVLYGALAIQLFFPFNIFLIGYFAAIFCLPVYIVCRPGRDKIEFVKVTGLFVRWSIIGIISIGFLYSLSFWVVRAGYHLTFRTEDNQKLDEETVHSWSLSDLRFKDAGALNELSRVFYLNEIKNPYLFLTNRVFRRGPVALFSSKHTVGVFAYRIFFKSSDEDILEPIQFFDTNGGRGKYDRQYLTLNVFQGSMYTLGDLVYMSKYKSEDEFTDDMGKAFNKVIEPLILFAKSHYKGKSDIDEAWIELLPIGNDCSFACDQTHEWKEVFTYDFNNETLNMTSPNINECCWQSRHYRLPNFYQRLLLRR